MGKKILFFSFISNFNLIRCPKKLYVLFYLRALSDWFLRAFVPICFNFFSLKSTFWKKLAQKVRLVSIKLARNERSSSDPFCQKSVHVLIYSLGWVRQLPNYPSINHAHVFRVSCTVPHSSHLISLLCPKPVPSRLSFLLSALPSSCCYKPLHGKSLSFLLSSIESSSSSFSFFVFFNGHSSVFFF